MGCGGRRARGLARLQHCCPTIVALSDVALQAKKHKLGMQKRFTMKESWEGGEGMRFKRWAEMKEI